MSTAIALKRWPVRPRPEPDEGLSGYLLRLARLYGWNSVHGLCVDLIGRRPGNAALRNAPTVRALSSALSRVMDLPLADLLRQWDRLRQEHACFDSSRIISDVEIGPPRVCTDCVTETGYVKFAWQVAHITHCDTHATPLLGACPLCGETFSWSSDLLDGCPGCLVSWKALPRAVMNARWPVAGGDALDKLYRAYLTVILPGGLKQWPRQCLPYDAAGHEKWMQRAYAAVYSNEANSALRSAGVNRCRTLGPLGPAAEQQWERLTSDLRLRDHAVEVPVGDAGDTGSADIALPPRVQRACSAQSFAGHVVSADLCAELLGVTPRTLHELVDAGIIPASSRATVLRDRLFELETVARRLNEMLQHQTITESEPFIRLDEAARLARLFGQQPWQVITWCAKGRVAFVHRNEGRFMDGLRIARADVIRVAEASLEGKQGEDFARTEVLEILNMTETGLDALSRAGFMPSKRWAALGTHFERKAVLGFMRRFRVARREAILNDTELSTAWQAILADGCHPVLERAGQGCFLGVASVGHLQSHD